jgi:large subunit ribosomal protein L1
LAELEGNKTAAKTFVRSYDWFIAEAQLMTTVGRVLGRYLGPIGKMPKLLPPGTDPAILAQQFSKTVLLRIKDSPVLHCVVGNEKMPNEQIAENIKKVVDEVQQSLPPKAKIKAVWLKLTMSQAVRIDSYDNERK